MLMLPTPISYFLKYFLQSVCISFCAILSVCLSISAEDFLNNTWCHIRSKTCTADYQKSFYVKSVKIQQCLSFNSFIEITNNIQLFKINNFTLYVHICMYTYIYTHYKYSCKTSCCCTYIIIFYYILFAQIKVLQLVKVFHFCPAV